MKKVIYLFFALFLVIPAQGIGQEKADVIEEFPEYCLVLDQDVEAKVFTIGLEVEYSLSDKGLDFYLGCDNFLAALEVLDKLGDVVPVGKQASCGDINDNASALVIGYKQGSSHRVTPHRILSFS